MSDTAQAPLFATAATPDSLRHGTKYCYATWITGVLAGTDHCAWRPWYRSTYRYAKLVQADRQAALDAWIVQHDGMVNARVAALKADGWTVTVEEENAFKLKGRAVLLAGKPDIVAIRGTDVLVIDAKSGQPRPSDEQQVLLYMWVLPRVMDLPAGAVIRGEIQYRGSSLAIPSERLTSTAVARIVSTLVVIGQSIPPARTPSLSECGFCDLAACPERMAAPGHSGESEDF